MRAGKTATPQLHQKSYALGVNGPPIMTQNWAKIEAVKLTNQCSYFCFSLSFLFLILHNFLLEVL